MKDNEKTGMIYKIEIGDNLYVGSTISKFLSDRQSTHNYNLKKFPHRKLYKMCLDNNITSIKCVWVADIKYSNVNELRKLEEEYRKQLNGNLNSNICYQTKESELEYRKAYKNEHKEQITNYNKIYVKKNKDILKEKRKIYELENKEKIKETHKKYNIPIECECGCKITKCKLQRHKKTKKHLKNIIKLQSN